MKQYYFPPSGDCGAAFAARLAEMEPDSILNLQSGRYVFRKKDAAAFPFAVSNANADDGTLFERHAAVLLRGMRNIVIDGHGAEFWFEGDVSPIFLLNCESVVLRGFSVHFFCPRVSEMQLVRKEGCCAEFLASADSPFIIRENRLFWLDPDGVPEAPETVIAQSASAEGLRNLRSNFNPVRAALSAERVGEREILLNFESPFPGMAGDVWQFRNPARNEVGILIDHCSDIMLESLTLRFTPGLGVIAQMSAGLEFRNLIHEPEPGRICAAFADCIHISSCRGRFELAESRFCGAQDDPLNIHGTYLKLERQEGPDIFLRFMQPETWGILPFEPDDRVALVDGHSLVRLEFRTVKAAELEGSHGVHLTLSEPFADLPEYAVIENMSAYPDAEIHDCRFAGYPTRGILLTSAGKCAIRRNTFIHASGSPVIYISGDAGSWFESGGVTDLEISGNEFRGSGCSVIEIVPETAAGSSEPVHRNIRIHGNRFPDCASPFLRVRNTENLLCDIPPAFICGSRGK